MPDKGAMKHALALAALLAATSAAAMSPDMAQGELLPGWREADGQHIAGLRITLADGWKTYWRAPGEGGIPARFDWSGSQNLASIAPLWPTPQVFDTNGMRSVGYVSGFILPLAVTPARGDAPTVLTGTIAIGVCKEVCVPMALRVTAELPPQSVQRDADLAAALADRPMTAAEARVGDVSCTLTPIADGMRLTATLQMPRLPGAEAAVVEFADPTVWVAEASTERAGNAVTIIADMVPEAAQPFSVARSDIRLTVIGNGAAVDIPGCTGG